MAPSCVADTSWLFALLDDGDESHSLAVEQAATMEEIHVPVTVLVETLLLVKFRAQQTGQTEANALSATRSAVENLAGKATVRLGSPVYDQEATLHIWDAHPKLSFVDAAAIAAARRAAVELCTFDRRQRVAHQSGKP